MASVHRVRRMAARERREAETAPISKTALAVVKAGPENAALTFFERLARDPTVPVEKLEKLIELQERIMLFNAKTAFDAAFAVMQGQIPIVAKNGRVVIPAKEGKSGGTYRFATHADIQRVLRPILEAHGFTIRHRNDLMDDGRTKITGILSHRDGHSEEDTFVTASDPTGSKNAIQAIGSAREYGRRYTTCALLNIATEEQDDDGHGASAPARSYERPAAGHDGSGSEVISQKQRQRLFVIMGKSHRAETEVRMWLKVRFGLDSTKGIRRMDYDFICKAIEADATLPHADLPDDREPGEEG